MLPPPNPKTSTRAADPIKVPMIIRASFRLRMAVADEAVRVRPAVDAGATTTTAVAMVCALSALRDCLFCMSCKSESRPDRQRR